MAAVLASLKIWLVVDMYNYAGVTCPLWKSFRQAWPNYYKGWHRPLSPRPDGTTSSDATAVPYLLSVETSTTELTNQLA